MKHIMMLLSCISLCSYQVVFSVPGTGYSTLKNSGTQDLAQDFFQTPADVNNNDVQVHFYEELQQLKQKIDKGEDIRNLFDGDIRILFKADESKKIPLFYASQASSVENIIYLLGKMAQLSSDFKNEWIYSENSYFTNILQNKSFALDQKTELFSKFLEAGFNPDYSEQEFGNLLIKILWIFFDRNKKILDIENIKKFYDLLFLKNNSQQKPYSNINQYINMQNLRGNILLYIFFMVDNSHVENIEQLNRFIEYIVTKYQLDTTSIIINDEKNKYISYPLFFKLWLSIPSLFYIDLLFDQGKLSDDFQLVMNFNNNYVNVQQNVLQHNFVSLFHEYHLYSKIVDPAIRLSESKEKKELFLNLLFNLINKLFSTKYLQSFDLSKTFFVFVDNDHSEEFSILLLILNCLRCELRVELSNVGQAFSLGLHNVLYLNPDNIKSVNIEKIEIWNKRIIELWEQFFSFRVPIDTISEQLCKNMMESIEIIERQVSELIANLLNIRTKLQKEPQKQRLLDSIRNRWIKLKDKGLLIVKQQLIKHQQTLQTKKAEAAAVSLKEVLPVTTVRIYQGDSDDSEDDTSTKLPEVKVENGTNTTVSQESVQADEENQRKSIELEHFKELKKQFRTQEKARRKIIVNQEDQETQKLLENYAQAKKQIKKQDDEKRRRMKYQEHSVEDETDEGYSQSAASSPKKIKKIYSKTLWEKILEEQEVPFGSTPQEVCDEIIKKIAVSLQKIDEKLTFTAGKPIDLFNKKVIVDIAHIVNLKPVVQDRKIDLKGGHSYQALSNLMMTGIIENQKVQQDRSTQCWKFLGVNSINGQSMIKTTFPDGWSFQDIYDALVKHTKKSSIRSASNDEIEIQATIEYKQVFFNVVIVLHKISDGEIWQMTTAYPIVEGSAVDKKPNLHTTSSSSSSASAASAAAAYPRF